MPYPRYGGGSSGTGAGSGYGSGSYGGRSGSSSSYHGGVSPWAGSGGGAGLHGATPKVDPVALVGNLVGAMMGAGGSGGNPLQQLAGIAMASAAMGPSGQDRSRGYERDRRDRQQVSDGGQGGGYLVFARVLQPDLVSSPPVPSLDSSLCSGERGLRPGGTSAAAAGSGGATGSIAGTAAAAEREAPSQGKPADRDGSCISLPFNISSTSVMHSSLNPRTIA